MSHPPSIGFKCFEATVNLEHDVLTPRSLNASWTTLTPISVVRVFVSVLWTQGANGIKPSITYNSYLSNCYGSRVQASPNFVDTQFSLCLYFWSTRYNFTFTAFAPALQMSPRTTLVGSVFSLRYARTLLYEYR